uniref:Phage tail assembly chaperone-like domain-containing protein n=1 Tax=viral metagenome TaxID=1070528 RepID=A0A6C0CYF9_9ZZZZ
MEADYYTTICSIRPGSEFTINGNDYTSLVWNDSDSTKPSEQEILNKIEDNENILKYEILRIERNKKLIESDKYMIIDFPNITQSRVESFKLYRQNLRDLPGTININDLSLTYDDTNPLSGLTWPTLP